MMRGTTYKNIVCLLLILIFSSCAGADKPYLISTPGNGTDPGTTTPPPSGGNRNTACQVHLDATLQIITKVGNTDPDVTPDPDGTIVTDEKPLPQITLNLEGSNIAMYGDDFQDATIELNGSNYTMRQVEGTKASGPFDASTGSMTLDGVSFIIKGANISLPTFTLTTGTTQDFVGDGGTINATGSPIDQASKAVKLVGGFVLPKSFPAFPGIALIVIMKGTVDNVPDPATCSGGGGGIVFKEIVLDKDNKEAESPLASENTLLMGRVFVPEAGVDAVNANDTRFVQTKKLRIRNNNSSPISIDFNAISGFNFAPAQVTIPTQGQADVTVTFKASPVAYSANEPALNEDKKLDVSVGNSKLTFAGSYKRANPELTVEGTESNATTTVDLGVIPVKVTGTDENPKLSCSNQTGSYYLARKLVVKNTGIRPLEIKKILAPVDTDQDNWSDACPSYGKEFQRMALAIQNNANCEMKKIQGHNYITDRCSIPVSPVGTEEDKKPGVNFKLVYIPKNASGIKDKSKDTGEMSIESNDPFYSTTPLKMTLLAGVSKDNSDSISMSKVREGVASKSKIKQDGSLNINIPETFVGNTFDQVVVVKNASSEALQVKEVILEEAEGEKFQLCMASADLKKAQDASCAHVNKNVITQIPAMSLSNEEGMSYFVVRFLKPEGAKPPPHSGKLTVSYVSGNAPDAKNDFRVNLVGTVGAKPFNGRVDIRVEAITSFIDNEYAGVTDSLDFRDPSYPDTVKSGPMHLFFKPSSNDPDDPIYDIDILSRVENPQTVKVQDLPLSDRQKLVRLPSDKFMRDAFGNKYPEDDSAFKVCTDPADISGSSYVKTTCSFFYYLLSRDSANVPLGKFNSETGEMTVPEIDFHVQNPNHATLGAYLESMKTDSHLKVTLTTQMINAYRDLNKTTLVPVVTKYSEVVPLGIPNSVVQNFLTNPLNKCSPDYDRRDDFVNKDSTPPPTFSCFLHQLSPGGDYYLRGEPALDVKDGEKSIVLVFLTKWGNAAEDKIPFFFYNEPMWIAIQGRMRQCEPPPNGQEINVKTQKCRASDTN